jgi:hypothetical protein
VTNGRKKRSRKTAQPRTDQREDDAGRNHPDHKEARGHQRLEETRERIEEIAVVIQPDEALRGRARRAQDTGVEDVHEGAEREDQEQREGGAR